jgi:transcriptional regulator with PAS, ATPase and Fis domain
MVIFPAPTEGVSVAMPKGGSPTPTARSPILASPAGDDRVAMAIRFTLGREAKVIELGDEPLTLGGEAPANVVLEHREVSKLHARILRVPGGWDLQDAGSTNGVWLGGRQVGSVRLADGVAFTLSAGRGAPRGEVMPLADALEMAPERGALAAILGSSAAAKEQRRLVLTYAPFDDPVHFTGETGVGKTLLAAALCRARNDKHRLEVVDSTILTSGDLAQSLLFGHTRNSFTGAVADKPGVLELANGTTVLIDEIGDLLAQYQGLLMRAIVEKKVRRWGDTAERHVSFRLASATLHDLPAFVKAGRFRQDLYERICTFVIHVAPLRERLQDVPVLARTFLAARGADFKLSDGALERLMAYPYPGNIRELERILVRALATRTGTEIAATDLAFPRPLEEAAKGLVVPPHQLRAFLEDFERESCLRCFEECGKNAHAAAEKLGYPYTSLRRRLIHWGAIAA